MVILSLDVSQDCCLGMAVRLTMTTSRFLSLTYCQLVVVVVLVVGVSTLGLNAHGRHGNVIRRIFLCTVIMLCANALDLYYNYVFM